MPLSLESERARYVSAADRRRRGGRFDVTRNPDDDENETRAHEKREDEDDADNKQATTPQSSKFIHDLPYFL